MSTKKPQDNNKTPQSLDKTGTDTLLALLTSSTRTEAAEVLGIDRKTLYLRIEKYGLNEHLDRIPEMALQSLKMGSVKAAENYIKKIDHRDAKISLEASNQVLDRIGLGAKTQQTNIQNNVVVVPSNLIDKYNDSKISGSKPDA